MSRRTRNKHELIKQVKTLYKQLDPALQHAFFNHQHFLITKKKIVMRNEKASSTNIR